MIGLLRRLVDRDKYESIKSWNRCIEKLIIGSTTSKDVEHLFIHSI